MSSRSDSRAVALIFDTEYTFLEAEGNMHVTSQQKSETPIGIVPLTSAGSTKDWI